MLCLENVFCGFCCLARFCWECIWCYQKKNILKQKEKLLNNYLVYLKHQQEYLDKVEFKTSVNFRLWYGKLKKCVSGYNGLWFLSFRGLHCRGINSFTILFFAPLLSSRMNWRLPVESIAASFMLCKSDTRNIVCSGCGSRWSILIFDGFSVSNLMLASERLNWIWIDHPVWCVLDDSPDDRSFWFFCYFCIAAFFNC